MSIITHVNLSAIDLNLLHVLHVLLADPSVARAARRLNVTSPAVSNSLSRLRSMLGDPLFVRRGRGLVPTPFALELKPALELAIHQLHKVVSREAPDPASSTRELTLALADSDQIASLPSLAAEFARRMPRARLRIVSVDTLISRGGLEAAAADAVIAPKELAKGYHFAPLYREVGAFFVRRGHRLARRKLSKKQFSELRYVDAHIALGGGGAGHRAAEQEMRRRDVDRHVVVTVPSFSAAAMVAASSDLVAGLPCRVVSSLSGAAPLIRLRGPLPPMSFEMQLVWHERTEHDAVARYFRELTVAALRGSAG